MTERGMIFNAEMVNAILSGRKVQTRRPIKWKQTRFTEIGEREDGSKWPWSEDTENVCDYWHPCPFGAVGDRIWVRETWAEAGASAPDLTLYRANYPEHVPPQYENVPTVTSICWTPSIFMPRWASRILLEITDVRVDRLNGISEADARAEGMPSAGELLPDYPDTYLTPVGDFATAKVAFQRLWESIYGKENWQADPWVWVIGFKRIEGNSHATD
ncbi:ASCH domain-containing protein [Citrobacter braakii]